MDTEALKSRAEEVGKDVASTRAYSPDIYSYMEYDTGYVCVRFIDKHTGPDKGYHKDAVVALMLAQNFDEGEFRKKCSEALEALDHDREEHGLD